MREELVDEEPRRGDARGGMWTEMMTVINDERAGGNERASRDVLIWRSLNEVWGSNGALSATLHESPSSFGRSANEEQQLPDPPKRA